MSGEQEQEKQDDEDRDEDRDEDEEALSAMRRAFNLPPGNSIPLEFTVESAGRQMDLGELMLAVQHIRYCVSVAIFLSHYVNWKLALGPQPVAMKSTFRRFETWLRALPPDHATYFDDFEIASKISGDLQQFGVTRRSPFYNEVDKISTDSDPDIANKFRDVDLLFFGAFLTNPTTLQILASAAGTTTVLLGLFFGGIQLLKEIGAPQCRDKAAQVAQVQTDALVANKPNLGQNKYSQALGDINKAYEVTASACGATASYIDIKLAFDKIVDFGVRVAPIGVAEARPEQE